MPATPASVFLFTPASSALAVAEVVVVVCDLSCLVFLSVGQLLAQCCSCLVPSHCQFLSVILSFFLRRFFYQSPSCLEPSPCFLSVVLTSVSSFTRLHEPSGTKSLFLSVVLTLSVLLPGSMSHLAPSPCFCQSFYLIVSSFK